MRLPAAEYRPLLQLQLPAGPVDVRSRQVLAQLHSLTVEGQQLVEAHQAPRVALPRAAETAAELDSRPAGAREPMAEQQPDEEENAAELKLGSGACSLCACAC